MANKRIPLVTKELLDELDRVFPGTVPASLQTHDEYVLLSGNQQVIQKIHQWYEMQGGKVLGGT